MKDQDPFAPTADEPMTSPLGGRLHSGDRREALARRWTGYVALVRICPTCEWENREHDLFCANCSADIRTVDPTTSSRAKAGVDLLQRRMRREDLRRKRTRPEGPVAGGGWIIIGAIVLALSLFAQADPFIRNLIWLVGLVLLLIGMFQIRRDTNALKAWGAILGATTAGLLVFVSYQALANQPTTDQTPTPSLEPTSALAIAPPATPNPGIAAIRGSVSMYRGDPAHTGMLAGPAPVSTPGLAWRFDSGAEIYSSPAIVDNRLFFASKSGFVYALEASTGNQIWRFQMSEYVARSSPAVVNGTVYIGGGFTFYALDAATGAEKWHVDLAYAGQGTPTVEGNMVVVTSQEGQLYAIAADSGEFLWKLGTRGLVFGAPALSADKVIYGTDSGEITAMDRASGRTIWRVTGDGPIFAAPVIANDRVIITTQTGKLLVLDLLTGNTIWKADRGGNASAAVVGDTVIVSASDGGVYGYDLATGEQRWIFASGAKNVTSAVSAGNVILVGVGDQLVALDPETGAQLWYYLAGDVIETSPVVLDGYVFFGNRDGFLYAVTDRPEANP